MLTREKQMIQENENVSLKITELKTRDKTKFEELENALIQEQIDAMERYSNMLKNRITIFHDKINALGYL